VEEVEEVVVVEVEELEDLEEEVESLATSLAMSVKRLLEASAVAGSRNIRPVAKRPGGGRERPCSSLSTVV